jgi:hypothetical protein
VDLDARIRRLVYDATIADGKPPRIASLTALLANDGAGVAPSEQDVRDALTQLAGARVFVLQPTTGELLMVPPFSAVPTSFPVESPTHHSYANCVWDGLGVAITLRQPVRVTTACGCCGDQLTIAVATDAPPPDEWVVHFAVPAAKWWDDVVFT